MGSCSPKLPFINLADETLKPGSSKWVEVSSDVRKALEEYGCFEASYDKVPLELQGSIVKAMEELFSLPVETKKRNVCPKPYVGYLNHNNLSESLGLQNSNILENVDEFARQLYPDGNKNISETIQLFSEKLAEIDVMVRTMIMESYGIEKYIDEHLNSSNYRMRLMKYTAPPDDVDVDADTTAVDGTDPNVGVEVNADVSEVNADVSEVNANTDVSEVNVGDDGNADANGDADTNSDANTGVTSGVNVNPDGGINVKVNVDADDGVIANTGVNVNVNVEAADGVIANTGVNVNVNVDAADGETGAIAIAAETGVEANDDCADVDAKKLSFPYHTDKNFITVLFQHEIEGLEVETKDGKWIRVKPRPNTFVVIAGDSISALMNGRIPPAYHRVRITEKKRTRYTAAIFTCPKPGYIIDSPKELVDEKHPRAFPPFDYLDFFHFFHTEAGSKAPSTLRAYRAVAGA